MAEPPPRAALENGTGVACNKLGASSATARINTMGKSQARLCSIPGLAHMPAEGPPGLANFPGL